MTEPGDEENLTCPLCDKSFAKIDDLFQHFRGKPGHMRLILAEFASMKAELAALKDAVTAWRTLAQERAKR